jgi:hypothetical protein
VESKKTIIHRMADVELVNCPKKRSGRESKGCVKAPQDLRGTQTCC